jgi:hypothetical protein
MPTPSSGTIRFTDISNEFGIPSGRNLGAYRISQTVGTLSNLPLDVNIPQSGTIKFSDFYNKRLNVVVNYTNIPDSSTRLNARSSYNANSNIVVIGGFRGRPSTPENIRVLINLNTRVGSSKGSITNVAVRTGNWTSSSGSALSTVRLELGSSSRIYGAGGDGGNANGGNGTGGTSAIGIEYPTTVINRGRIQRGGGGGGAGAFRQYSVRTGKKNKGNVPSYSTGGGGGGGAGFPFGSGGASIGGAYGFGSNGSAGAGGNYETAGAGGVGGVEAGSGGSGGQFGNGSNGGSTANQSGGIGGSSGFAFVISSSGSITSLQNFGTIIGDNLNNTDPT